MSLVSSESTSVTGIYWPRHLIRDVNLTFMHSAITTAETAGISAAN